jgi:hypothetical protein
MCLYSTAQARYRREVMRPITQCYVTVTWIGFSLPGFRPNMLHMLYMFFIYIPLPHKDSHFQRPGFPFTINLIN